MKISKVLEALNEKIENLEREIWLKESTIGYLNEEIQNLKAENEELKKKKEW